jgi:hypothetical protein
MALDISRPEANVLSMDIFYYLDSIPGLHSFMLFIKEQNQLQSSRTHGEKAFPLNNCTA